MAKYINDLGDAYDEEELIQFANDQETTLDDIISRNELTKEGEDNDIIVDEKDLEKPGKKKTVVKKGAGATVKSTASKSVKPSSVSKKPRSLFDQLYFPQNIPFDEVVRIKTEKDKIAVDKKKKEKEKFNKYILSQGIPGTGSNKIIDTPVNNKELEETVRNAQKDKYYRLQQFGNGLSPSLARVEGDYQWDKNGIKSPSNASIKRNMDAAVAKQEEKDQQTLNTYGERLGSNVWLSDDELATGEGGRAIFGAINPNNNPTGLVNIMGGPTKTSWETTTNLLGMGMAEGRQVPDYEANPNAQLLVKNLPSLQNKWILNNGQLQMQIDQKKGIDVYAKASNNGKLFLSNDEKKLQDNQSLLLKAKKSNNYLEVNRLEYEIKKQREDLSLGGRLYDPATGKLLTINEKKKVVTARDEKAKQIAEDTPHNTLSQMQTKTYYELVALSKEAYNKKNNIKGSESTVEKIGGALKSYLHMGDQKGTNFGTDFDSDMVNLKYVISKGVLPKTLNELPGKHPISLAFNKKLQQYLTLTKAIELNNDPVTTESNNRAVDFLDGTFKAFTREGIYSAGGIQNRKEVATTFNDMMETAGFEYKNKNVLDKKVETTWKDIAIGSTAEMTPLIAAMFLTKKASGPQITQAANIANKVISNAGNNTKIVNATAKLFTGGMAEVVHMQMADKVLGVTTGAPPTDGTFAFSLGVGNVAAENLIKTMTTNKIPYLTPILMALSTKSNLVSKTAQVTTGAVIGTATMKIAEGATLIKNELTANGNIDQAKEWEELSDNQHIAGTFWSMMMLGAFAPKGFHDALKTDIKRIPLFNNESVKAGKLLDIDHKLPADAKDLQVRDNEIDIAEQKALDALNKKQEQTPMEFEAMAKEEVKIRKAANVLRGDLEIKNAKLNIEAGHDAPSMTDVWIATNKLKYGDQLNGADANALSTTPASIIKNQLGLNSNDPFYRLVKREQQYAQKFGEILDQRGIFGDSEERKGILNNLFKIKGITQEINSLKEQVKSDPTIEGLNNSKIVELEGKVEELHVKNADLQDAHKIKTDRSFDISLQAAIDLVDQTGGPAPVKHETQEEFNKAYMEIMNTNELPEGSNAFRDQSTGVMHFNMTKAKEEGATGTGPHETGHHILADWMKDSEGNLTEEGVQFIDDWKKKLSPKELGVVDKRINENYKYKTDENGKVVEEDKQKYYEEYLTAFTEAVASGELTYKAEVFSKLKAPFEKLLEKVGYKKPRFLPGEAGAKEMYTMLKDLAESAKGGTVSQMAKDFAAKQKETSQVTDATGVVFSKTKVAEVQAKIDKLEDQFDKDEIEYDDYTNRLTNLELELKKAKALPEDAPVVEIKKVETKKSESTEKAPRSKTNLQNLLDTKYEGNPKKMASDGLTYTPSGSVTNDFSKSVIGKELGGSVETITRRLYDPIADDAKRGVSREEYKNALIQSASLLINNEFDPSKQSLDKFISSRLNLRANALAYELGIEGATKGGIKKDAAEEKGLMASETADQGFESSVAEKPKYKDSIESKVLEQPVVDEITKKIITHVRTIKNRIDAPVSLNRTVTPLISEIISEMGKQADIDIKKAMGGKKDNELENFLLKNKRYVLENMTTTFLMGANGKGGLPEAIQKRVNGKWLNYPDWVSQKIDRESVSTDNAGRTSGAELVRRLPNAFNNISDKVYLANVIGPDGNPHRGAKERFAKGIAEEIVLDLVKKDLENKGPIYDNLATNQQRLGVEMTEAFAVEFARQSERGNVKHSNTGNKVIDKAQNDFKDLFMNASKDSKFDMFRYLEDRAYAGISNQDKDKLDTAYNNLQNAYISDFNNAKNKVFKEKYTSAEDVSDYISDYIGNNLKTKQILIGSKTKGWEKNEKNRANIQAAKAYVLEDLKAQLLDAPDLESKKLAADAFILTFKAPLANVTGAGKWFFDNNKGFLKELNEIPEFKELGYKLIGGEKNTTIVDKEGNNPAVVWGQSSKSGDITLSLQSGKDLIDKKSRDAQSDRFRETTLNFADRLKKSNLSAEQKAVLCVSLGENTRGALRSLGKVDGILPIADFEKNPEYEYEHAVPIENLVQALISYTTELPFHGRYKNGMTREELDAYLNESKVALIPSKMATLVNVFYKDKAPGEIVPGETNIYNERYFSPKMLKYLADNGIVVSAADLIPVTGDGKSLPAVDLEKRNAVRKSNNTTIAVTNSLGVPKESKGISVFDFDDTSAFTSGSVLYTMPNGNKGKLNAEEFAKKGDAILNAGGVFDFSEFSKVVDGKPGPMVEKMKKMIAKFGNENFFILTARPANAAGPIKEFLDTIGIDIPIENITGLGSSLAQSKADWMTAKAAEGYNDFYFADDAIQNVEAVKKALEVLDVKSKIQQAKIQFSKTISPTFNRIIEENKGTERYKVFSDVVARKRGAKLNKYDFYVPPSAADFELLLYNFMGKGKAGEGHKKFFSDSLLKPYSNGSDLMDAARQSIKNEYKDLTTSFPDISKKIEKLTPDKDFTYDQAIRVAMWKESGVEVPGLSKTDGNKLTNLVNSDPELKAFKAGLIAMGRQGAGWIKPTEYWDSSTIISDLHGITEGEGRKKFLGEFIENYEQMFGTWENGKLVGPNINKIEALYGTNVREALEDSLYRMTNGKNRSYGKDKETSAWSNWVNGSTGAIMFMNTRSAALQLIGAVNFLNLRDNNPVAAAKAFANQPQYWKDFSRIWNSDKMKERRGGLKEDVAAAEIANAAAGSKNKPAAVMAYLLKIGYTPTQLADSFAIASGGAPFYRNRIKTFLKEGKTEVEAEQLAWEEFTKVSDETQQSGDPRDISKQQASGAGRLLLTFQNTAMQQSRIVKKSYLDLKNGRGDAKTHIAKITYYLAIQNALFSALQQGLFAVAFDDDDKQLDPEKEKAKAKTVNQKLMGVADGILDTILRGTGFGGGVVSILKNMTTKYLDEKDKGFKADYAKVMLEGANISPPIGSKLRKLYTGLQQTKFEKDLIEERGWGITQDGRVHLGPMYGVSGKLVEATTNFPMDRLVNKIENVSQAMNSENKAWQRVAVGLGFTPYSVGIEDSKGDLEIRAKAKEVRAEEGKIKAKETRQRTKDSIRALPIEERIKLKKEDALKRRANKMAEIKRRQAMNKY
jgi:hypothetical protein